MNRLKELRDEKKESQEDIGKLIGTSGQAVGQYELGKRGLSQDKMIILANHFNCSVDYLLGKSNIRNPEEIKNIPHANSGGLDTEGLDEEDLLELQKQVDYIKKLKGKSNER